ncbi:MAG TPA: hypothetical protein VGE92_08085 [Steroidobacteraceae bacterium]
MGRTRHNPFANSKVDHYVTVWDLHWGVIDCQRLGSGGVDLRGALGAALRRLELEGWTAQGSGDFGFVFIMRGTERRLVTLSSRDPHNATAQSFSPFGARL